MKNHSVSLAGNFAICQTRIMTLNQMKIKRANLSDGKEHLFKEK